MSANYTINLQYDLNDMASSTNWKGTYSIQYQGRAAPTTLMLKSKTLPNMAKELKDNMEKTNNKKYVYSISQRDAHIEVLIQDGDDVKETLDHKVSFLTRGNEYSIMISGDVVNRSDTNHFSLFKMMRFDSNDYAKKKYGENGKAMFKKYINFGVDLKEYDPNPPRQEMLCDIGPVDHFNNDMLSDGGFNADMFGGGGGDY